MPSAYVIATVVVAVIGVVTAFFAVDFSTQNTPHSYTAPTPQPRQNNDVGEGYDSIPGTSRQGDRSSAREDEKCAICLEYVRVGFVAQCKHEFHLQCIEQWKKACKSSTFPCPICRKNISSS